MRFDIHRLKSDLVLDVQADIVGSFGTRVVAPLLPVEIAPTITKRMHPVFQIDGTNWVLATHLLLAVPEKDLGPTIGNLAAHQDEIKSALNLLFDGF